MAEEGEVKPSHFLVNVRHLVAASWRCYRLHINGCFVHPLSVSVDVISVDVISARVGGGR